MSLDVPEIFAGSPAGVAILLIELLVHHYSFITHTKKIISQWLLLFQIAFFRHITH